MSRYDRYSEGAVSILMTTQDMALRHGRTTTDVPDLAQALVLTTMPEIMQRTGRGNAMLDEKLLLGVLEQLRMPAPELPATSIQLSEQFRQILGAAEALAGEQEVQASHVLEAAWPHVKDYIAPFFRDELQEAAEPVMSAMALEAPKPLERFCTELTDRDWPFFAREKELEQLMASMLKYWKPNPLIVGEAGVGKTALVRGLATRIRAGSVPQALKGARIFELNIADLLSGTTLHGELEENLRLMLAAVKEVPNSFLFIDEMHQIVPAFANNPISEVLKPALSKAGLRVIGATTLGDYARYLEKDSALMRRFQLVLVKEPLPEATRAILDGVRPDLEKHFGLPIDQAMLDRTLYLSGRYLPQRRNPDKSLDTLDRACAQAVFQGSTVLQESHLVDAVRTLGSMNDNASVDPHGALAGLETAIGSSIKGQDQAIAIVSRAVRVSKMRLDLHPARPDGAFLFTGPTGVGKTAMAESLARALSGRDDALFRIDMSEFFDAHHATRLLGAPPSYIGYEDQSLLSRAVASCAGGVLLLDELEKAHPQVHRVFLQILDSGRATDSSGKVLSFSSITIIATCNVGSDAGPVSGFMRDQNHAATVPMAELKRVFPPELLNRFDAIVPFRPLDHNDALAIVQERVVADANTALEREYGIRLVFSPQAIAAVVEQGFSKDFGARNLHRTWRIMVSDPLSDIVASLAPRTFSTAASGEPALWAVSLGAHGLEFSPP